MGNVTPHASWFKLARRIIFLFFEDHHVKQRGQRGRESQVPYKNSQLIKIHNWERIRSITEWTAKIPQLSFLLYSWTPHFPFHTALLHIIMNAWWLSCIVLEIMFELSMFLCLCPSSGLWLCLWLSLCLRIWEYRNEMIAGMVAGFVCKFVEYPLDTIKVQVQTQSRCVAGRCVHHTEYGFQWSMLLFGRWVSANVQNLNLFCHPARKYSDPLILHHEGWYWGLDLERRKWTPAEKSRERERKK